MILFEEPFESQIKSPEVRYTGSEQTEYNVSSDAVAKPHQLFEYTGSNAGGS